MTRHIALLPGALLAVLAVSCGVEAPPDPTTAEKDLAVAEAIAPPQTLTLSCQAPGTGFGEVAIAPVATPGVLPFVPLTSLRTVPNPLIQRDLRGRLLVPDELINYIVDMNAALQLGKAFFWDIQAGSDDKVSCATCHFAGGADTRIANTLNPGPNGTFDKATVNATLTAGHFPFTSLAAGTDADDIAGSQGVRAATFGGLSATGEETLSPAVDPYFGTARQVTGLQAPPITNAVFNHRNFWNARAQPEFNGVNNWGRRDPLSRVYYVADTLGNIGTVDIKIPNASLASQAVGPVLSTVEMSAAGRTFPDVGKKLLLRKPLGLQKVDGRDGVLGALADTKGKGLKTTYAALIQKAFTTTWWNSTKTVAIGGKSYKLMEANFPLYWGISVMLYQASLVADDSPMDRYVASRTFDLNTGLLAAHDPTLLDPVVARLAAQGITIPNEDGVGSRPVTRQDILLGLDLFEKPLPLPNETAIGPGQGTGCNLCHVGAETTAASTGNLTGGNEPAEIHFKNIGYDLRMERMFMGVRTPPPTAPHPPPPVPAGTDVITFDTGTYAVNVVSKNGVAQEPEPVPVMVYDGGWYNVGVRPTAEGNGIGDVDAFNKPLSWVQYFQTTLPNPSQIKVPGAGLGCVDANGIPVSPPAAPVGSVFAGEVVNPLTGLPLLSGGLTATEASDVAGSFKTSHLRNVEITGPYFHNGGKATLMQAVELYDDGGDFQNATLSPLIRPLGLTHDQRAALVAFLLAMTDDRVLYQKAPFDHPELILPAGETATGADELSTMPAVGATGSTAPLPRFLGLNPFSY